MRQSDSTQRSFRSFPYVLCAVFLCTAACAEVGREFTVGPGKEHETISSALAEMQDGDICTVTPGTYRECIDVKLNGVTLRGRGRVVISGCDVAETSEPCTVNKQKGLKVDGHARVYDVFCGGQYLHPARYPNKTAPMTSNRDWSESYIGPAGNIGLRDNAQRAFPTLSDGYYVGLHSTGSGLASWYSLTLPITHIGKAGYIHVDKQNVSSGYMGKYGRGKGVGYICGAKAVLDAPGEWYTDGESVLLIPPEGTGSNVELRTRLYGAVITGNGVVLENLRFRAAAARVEGNNVAFKGCAFDYISPFQHNANPEGNRSIQSPASCWGVPENGTAGVFVKGNAFRAENCRFSKSWWCGMMIRGNRALVENCLFEDMNWMAKRCAGLFSWGDENVVRYCTFRNMGGAAIEGGNANWIRQYAKRNVWEYNYIENACTLIVDQGFFYVNHQRGNNPEAGSVWRYNVGKGSRGPEKGDWKRTAVGYYVDNNSSGYRVHNNIAIDAEEAIRYNDFADGEKAGRNVRFYNNTFYRCKRIAISGRRLDADVILVNNLSLPRSGLTFKPRAAKMKWNNNIESLPASALKDPAGMDFTPVAERLKTGGVPVDDKPVKYIGAVDPQKGMWRYGADVSKLTAP